MRFYSSPMLNYARGYRITTRENGRGKIIFETMVFDRAGKLTEDIFTHNVHDAIATHLAAVNKYETR